MLNNDVGSSALDAALDAVPDDVVEGPLPSCDPVAVMDWLPELSCEVWLVSMEVEVSDDVPLCEPTFMPAMGLLVDSCDDEVRVPESDPLELVPVVMPPCELLGLKVDVGSPLLVESCDAEVCVPETDPLELLPVDMPSCKLLGFEEDVGSPPLDVLPSAKPLVPILLTLVSWLDGVPIVVDFAP